ncbi:MAG: helix-turn-helix transcriptional regulator [Acidobacteria bacterium]|nr:helix-turn-helix transcriptional regulator [Acidobacteriota bacterium]
MGYTGQVILRNLVRESRRRAGLTQAELGHRAGVPQSTIARIESGARTPSTDMVERLVRATGFEVRARLGEPDPETASLFSRTLRRTPAQRLADATRAARFVLRGQRQLRKRVRG